MTKDAVVLLSGGLDSAVTLAIARAQGFTCHALSFDYGQRHRVELVAAGRVAQHLHAASHQWVQIDLRAFGGSALTSDLPVPKDRDAGAMASGIPVTYVPARNTIFLSYALALAEVRGSRDIFIGVNAIDYSGYPDCRPAYIAAFAAMANLATRAAVESAPDQPLTIHTPLIDLSKVQIIRRGLELSVDFSLTHSCYDPVPLATTEDAQRAQPGSTGQTADGANTGRTMPSRPCGHCDACLLRQRAFAELGLQDPALA